LRLLFSDLNLHIVVADKDGVIFLASDNSWLFHTIRPLSPSRLDAIRRVKRYPDKALTQWSTEQIENWDEVSKLVFLSDGSEHLGQATLLLSRGWEVHVFDATLEVDHYVYAAMLVSGLAVTLTFILALYLIQRREYLRDLREAAIRDFLTGLYTRRYMQDAATAQISRISRGQLNGIAAVMIDIDYFKLVNDRYGHRAGDQVLRAVGSAISLEIRRGDIPVRYGGEEFLVIINILNACDASCSVRRILTAIKQLQFRGSIKKLKITASAGVAHYRDGETLEELLERADGLLYQAKQDGRDRFYDDTCAKPQEPL